MSVVNLIVSILTEILSRPIAGVTHIFAPFKRFDTFCLFTSFLKKQI